MARKLKTYITNLGFFELALAAPSMKAALEAWGMGHNAFHQGFAKETDDPKIVAAAMAKPGVVLKRPVGSKGAFAQNAALPQDWALDAGGALPKPSKKVKAKAQEKKKSAPKSKAKPKKDDKADRAAIISFEKEKARRAREREKEDARAEARAAKERRERERDAGKAQAALDRAQARHDDAMAEIEAARDKLDRRAVLEKERWDEERDTLKADLRKAKG
ncbi:MAG: cell envelope biogenesis protein TolA [Pseudomonadota bacterium]